MAYWEWGHPDNDRVLLCVHGLTRTGRDFDIMARRLSQHYRVVCPDVVGRGKSDWLINAASYVVPQYVADMVTLIARLRPNRLDWIGTSMGGLIGLGLAGTLAMSKALRPARPGCGLQDSDSLQLGKVVFNDIGPRLNFSGLERISQYVGQPIQFDRFDQAVDYVRSVSAGFGPHDEDGWEDLTRFVFHKVDDHWVKHYDLRIAEPFAVQSEAAVQASEAILWKAYESIDSPILLVRGEQSDLFSAETAQEMLQRNTHASLYTVSNVGHAPTFRSDDQIDAVEQFLLG
ncbi:alpha/beta hydrolase [Parapusillimonas sp. SGNA-6]|nr:alpha/beta hydrolase [Parapusillimonas sp. SGNA-6]